jgi:hypothetical protein
MLIGILTLLGLIALVGTVLAADTPYVPDVGEIGWNEYPVYTGSTIYEGSMVGVIVASGYARAYVSGDIFVGHCREKVINAGASGSVNVSVLRGSYRLRVTLASVAITDVGKHVYASDDATYTLTQGTGNGVGVVHRYVTTNTCVVEFVANRGIAVATHSIQVVNGALTVGDAYSGLRVIVTAPAAHNEYGMSAYFETTITGTTAGHCYGVGSWINTASTPVLSAGHIIVPFEGGVYTGEAQAAGRIVFGGQHQAILAGAPASLHAWRLNTNRTITALIAAANPGSIGFTAGTGTSGVQAGYIPIADIVGVGVVYIRVYTSAT